MRLQINETAWSTILNVHYGACLSVIFALSIIPDVGSSQLGKINYYFSLDSVVLCALLIAYFFVDCIVANTRTGEFRKQTYYVLAALLWIWFLGYCIVISKSPQPEKYICIPLYLIGARAYQTYLYAQGKYDIDDLAAVWGAIISVFALLVATIMLWLGFALAHGLLHPDDLYSAIGKGSYQLSTISILNILMTFVLFLKITESYFYIKSQSDSTP
jgi:hypothetical protein